MEKITITRGLAELKLLDQRIQKEISTAVFMDVYQDRSSKVLKTQMVRADFEKKAKSDFDSIAALVKRRNAIKGKILLSNAMTKVSIAKVEMSVAEAIDMKGAIRYEQAMLARMKHNMQVIKTDVENNRVKVNATVEAMMTQALGNDKKASGDEWDKIAKPFIEANEYKIVDPMGLQNWIDWSEKMIDGFLSEVDFVLSESNARTEIEI